LPGLEQRDAACRPAVTPVHTDPIRIPFSSRGSANFEPVKGDPLDLAALEGAAEEFRARVLRLAGTEE